MICIEFIYHLNDFFRDPPDQIVYVKKVPSSSADNTRTNSIIDSHLLNQKRRKSLKSFRNASLDVGSYLHPDGKIYYFIENCLIKKKSFGLGDES